MMRTLDDVIERYPEATHYWRLGRSKVGFKDRGVILWYRPYRHSHAARARWIPCGCTHEPGPGAKRQKIVRPT